ncbi:MAG TPA: DUF2079 domain-containing protein [Kiritimatiellia bacterium]|nr:DUF2079 domain-containing protein [Kiritimatiellia bacterium]
MHSPLANSATTGQSPTAVQPVSRVETWLTRGLMVVAGLLALGLLWSGFCAFTWRKFGLFDYGVYTNMIWNSGHGQLFRCLLDRTYLATHLSFSLALLGPLFYLWDHPFLLWVAQWLMLISGALILLRGALRAHVPAFLAWAIVLFLFGYHLNQQVLLSEFHGVSAYLLLVPWLYYCLRFQRRWVWLPWLLTLGLREDAGFIILPLLLYCAVRERWWPGYVYAALSVVYCLVAIQWLFPLLAGMSLQVRRAGHVNNPLGNLLNPATGLLRLRALLWVVLPVLPFVWRRSWLPLLVLPAVPLLIAMGSGTSNHYTYSLHYPAATMACLAVAMVEAARLRPSLAAPTSRRGALWVASALLLITAFSFRTQGYIPGSRPRVDATKTYSQIHESGLLGLRAARHIPTDGILRCAPHLAGFCANRRDLLDWAADPATTPPADFIFSEMKYLHNHRIGYHDELTSGDYGLVYFDGDYVLLQRGAPTNWNELLETAYECAPYGTRFPRIRLPKRFGRANQALTIPSLHWRGGKAEATGMLGAAPHITLSPGEYEAVFLFAARGRMGDDFWGELEVCRADNAQRLAAARIEPITTGRHELRTQRVEFSLNETTQVQAVVQCREAELWLVRTLFIPRGASWDL